MPVQKNEDNGSEKDGFAAVRLLSCLLPGREVYLSGDQPRRDDRVLPQKRDDIGVTPLDEGKEDERVHALAETLGTITVRNPLS